MENRKKTNFVAQGNKMKKRETKKKFKTRLRVFIKKIVRKAKRESMFKETNRKILFNFAFGLFALYCLYGKEICRTMNEIGFTSLFARGAQLLWKLPFALYEITKGFSAGQIAILLVAVYCYKKGCDLQKEKNSRVVRWSRLCR